MKSQAGFTLVEAMMAGVISAAIPLVILSLLSMSNSQLQRGTSRIRLTQIYDAVSEDILRTAYQSATARQAPCGGTFLTDNCGVLFYNVDGSFRKGFRVRLPNSSSTTAILQEATTAPTAWVNFMAGSEEVLVRSVAVGSNLKVDGHFRVYNAGAAPNTVEGLRFNLSISMDQGTKTEALSVQTESVLCRRALPWTEI